MLATITKIGDTITKNNNVIINISVANGFEKIFGVEKPKKKSFLMSMPAEAAQTLEVGMQEDIDLSSFEQVDREWNDDEGNAVVNTWLHTKV